MILILISLLLLPWRATGKRYPFGISNLVAELNYIVHLIVLICVYGELYWISAICWILIYFKVDSQFLLIELITKGIVGNWSTCKFWDSVLLNRPRCSDSSSRSQILILWYHCFFRNNSTSWAKIIALWNAYNFVRNSLMRFAVLASCVVCAGFRYFRRNE